jgi:GT2 family glycosyltransferase
MPTAHEFPADVEVVIVAHNNLDTLKATLQSVSDAACPATQIIVVDIASTDGTGSYMSETWPGARVIRLSKNLGPSPGRNAGIRAATSRFVLLMDADVRVTPEATSLLRTAMLADPNVKVGSPIVVHESQPDVIQYAGGALHFICEAVNPWLDRPLADRGTAPLDIGAAPTCALLLDREAALDVGLFDERYFIGKEDGDFTHRIKMAGYSILEVPAAVVLHRSRPRGTWLFYFQIRNRWHFMLKNYQWRTLFWILPPLLVHEPLQMIVLVLKGHGWTYLKAVAGLIAMLPALPRDRALANRIRRRNDADLLISGQLIVREDLAGSAFVRAGKALYESWLTGYWNLLKRTVLAS